MVTSWLTDDSEDEDIGRKVVRRKSHVRMLEDSESDQDGENAADEQQKSGEENQEEEASDKENSAAGNYP